jgi:hypothetical protein
MCLACIKPPNKRQLNTILYYTPSQKALTPQGQTHICQDLQSAQAMDRQTPVRGTPQCETKFNFERFNRNNFNIR